VGAERFETGYEKEVCFGVYLRAGILVSPHGASTTMIYLLTSTSLVLASPA
jgi:hypothetical protein